MCTEEDSGARGVKGEGKPTVSTVVAEEAVAAWLSTWHKGHFRDGGVSTCQGPGAEALHHGELRGDGIFSSDWF